MTYVISWVISTLKVERHVIDVPAIKNVSSYAKRTAWISDKYDIA